MYDAIIEEWVEINGYIWGYIYDDQKGRFDNGDEIRTSSVIAPELDKIGLSIRTKNSIYELGAKAGDCDED